jgi:hypothetical protein
MHRAPRMFVLSERYEVMVAFVCGSDAGTEGKLLAGFQEWVGGRLVGHPEASVSWVKLIADSCAPEGRAGPPSELSGDCQAAANDKLFDLLDEFLAQRQVNERSLSHCRRFRVYVLTVTARGRPSSSSGLGAVGQSAELVVYLAVGEPDQVARVGDDGDLGRDGRPVGRGQVHRQVAQPACMAFEQVFPRLAGALLRQSEGPARAEGDQVGEPLGPHRLVHPVRPETHSGPKFSRRHGVQRAQVTY